MLKVKKLSLIVGAVILTGTLWFCGALCSVNKANAAETNSTEVTIQVADSMEKIEWSAPTKIPLVVVGDGTLCGPDPEVLKIQNENVLTIHLTNIQVTPTNPWTFVADAAGDSSNTNDIASFAINFTNKNKTVQAVNALSGLDVSTWTELNLAYEGYTATDADDTLADNIAFSLSGNANKITQDLSSAKGFATITWTIAPGLAS